MTTLAWILAIIAVFLLGPTLIAYALPVAASRLIARITVSLALALQAATALYLVVVGFSSEWSGPGLVLEWLVVPGVPTAGATYLSLTNPPAAISVVVIGVFLLLLSLALIFSIGMLMFAPAVLTLLSGLFLIGSWRRAAGHIPDRHGTHART